MQILRAPSGVRRRLSQSVPANLAVLCLVPFLALASARAETYYGLPVVKTSQGYRIVDIRPALSGLRYLNDRAEREWACVNSSLPVCDVSIRGWKTAHLTAAQQSLATVPIPSGSTLFEFVPSRSSSLFVVGAMYYEDGRWTAVHAGASRDSEFVHMYDLGDGMFSPAGYLFANWCGNWSQQTPTVAVLLDYYSGFLSYGVVLNTATAPPVSYPDAPANTYKLIDRSLSWTEAKADAEARGGYLATVTSPAEWSNLVAQVGAANLANREIWLGASDAASEGSWRWVTGEAFQYSRWGSGQPNNSGGNQDYLHTWKGGWNDLAKSGVAHGKTYNDGYLCEWR